VRRGRGSRGLLVLSKAPGLCDTMGGAGPRQVRMNRKELRHRLISVLLQAAGPLDLGELAAQCGADPKDVLRALKDLLAEDRVVQGLLLPDRPGPQYRWAARWEEQAKELAAGSRKWKINVQGKTATVREEQVLGRTWTL